MAKKCVETYSPSNAVARKTPGKGIAMKIHYNNNNNNNLPIYIMRIYIIIILINSSLQSYISGETNIHYRENKIN